jgi:hypothetical protein
VQEVYEREGGKSDLQAALIAPAKKICIYILEEQI